MPTKDKLESAQNLEELFDVVSDCDAVIGQATRREVHDRNLLHRAVHVFVFDRSGRLFLQKRSMAKDRSPGLWDASCSGHVDSGEDYDTAAWRELDEEIGLRTPHPPERWFRVEAGPNTGWEFIWVYRLRSEGPFVLNPHEIDEGAWQSVLEVSRAISLTPERFTTPFREIWRRALAHGLADEKIGKTIRPFAGGTNLPYK